MVDRFRNWKEKLYAGWCVFRAQCKYWWLSQKKWQKALWIILLLLWLGLLIFSFIKTPPTVMSSDSLYCHTETTPPTVMSSDWRETRHL